MRPRCLKPGMRVVRMQATGRVLRVLERLPERRATLCQFEGAGAAHGPAEGLAGLVLVGDELMQRHYMHLPESRP